MTLAVPLPVDGAGLLSGGLATAVKLHCVIVAAVTERLATKKTPAIAVANRLRRAKPQRMSRTLISVSPPKKWKLSNSPGGRQCRHGSDGQAMLPEMSWKCEIHSLGHKPHRRGRIARMPKFTVSAVAFLTELSESLARCRVKTFRRSNITQANRNHFPHRDPLKKIALAAQREDLSPITDC